MKRSIVQEKSYLFSLRIIKLYQHITQKRQFILGQQILKSGTSIGANIEEALGAYSNKDFLSKITILYKEARETHYWLRLLKDSQLIEKNLSQSLISDCIELIKIISAIQRTTKKNNNL